MCVVAPFASAGSPSASNICVVYPAARTFFSALQSTVRHLTRSRSIFRAHFCLRVPSCRVRPGCSVFTRHGNPPSLTALWALCRQQFEPQLDAWCYSDAIAVCRLASDGRHDSGRSGSFGLPRWRRIGDASECVEVQLSIQFLTVFQSLSISFSTTHTPSKFLAASATRFFFCLFVVCPLSPLFRMCQ